MSIEIKAPTFPESVADGTVATWHKQPGEAVARDELIVDIETDKVVLEVVSPVDGVLEEIIKGEGETVLGEELIGRLREGAASKGAAASKEGAASRQEGAAAETVPAGELKVSPAARKLMEEEGLKVEQVEATGKGGLVTKEDVLNALKARDEAKRAPAPAPAAEAPAAAPASTREAAAKASPLALPAGERIEKRVPMTRLRARIAERLLDASRNTAMLTTFNEVDMAPVMDLRSRYRDAFEKAHGVRLGFMGFFVKAACEALKRFPAVNASIDGNDIVYHGYQDIGVAVSTDKGLVVPVLRDADQMGIGAIEDKVRDFGLRARDGKLGIEDMQGGTFTITNGGVFGSLMSTPILNPPQAAILGMHKIQERPMAVKGQVVIRPMMYLALSYDHRLIDGREAVQFLVAIKDLLEDPARMLLDI